MLQADKRDLVQDLREGRIGRRDFLKRAFALGISVSSAGAMLRALDASAAADPTLGEMDAQRVRNWYKTDPHSHSVVSAEAYPDMGIVSQAAQNNGYNAIFLTDHNHASSFEIYEITANHVVLNDSYTRWTTSTYGALTSTVNELVASPVYSGMRSLHLMSISGSYGETFVWTRRGPSFRAGDIILQVAIYPTRLDPGSGVYVSVAIGGDPSLAALHPNSGYTTQAGVISPGKSTVLVWQLGTARAPSGDPNARVLTYPLGPYTLNSWNFYTINISQALGDIPVADRPLDYNGLSHLKIAAAGNKGAAEAYFDAYSMDASAPLAPGDEVVYRNSLAHTYDSGLFKIFPSVELGQFKHAQRFNFAITDPSQFVGYANGIDGILATQQSGYLAQLNHPGIPGGVSPQEAIDTRGEGADQIEVNKDPMIDIWDQILLQGVQLLGIKSTDTHYAEYDTWDSTYVYATTLEFDPLMQAMFEGRTFAAHGFVGPVAFNLHSGSQEPYPARYPMYVPDSYGTTHVHLSVPGGLNSRDAIRWIRNGVVIAIDGPTGGVYDVTRTIPLNGPPTYVRAEVRAISSVVRALTQPIFFLTVPGLPTDKTFHIDAVLTADGRGYTKLITKGITASSWDAANRLLSQTLDNPANALVRELITTNAAPHGITVDEALIPMTDSLAAFNAAVGSIWYYSITSRLLYLKVLHTTNICNVTLNFS